MKSIRENILMELRPEPLKEFPLHWQYIYQEAQLGRHILFHAKDLKRFSRPSPTLERLPYNLQRFIDDSAKLFQLSDIRSLQLAIAEKPYLERLTLFKVYLSLIEQWRTLIKNQLH